jgi:hypothetical protein
MKKQNHPIWKILLSMIVVVAAIAMLAFTNSKVARHPVDLTVAAPFSSSVAASRPAALTHYANDLAQDHVSSAYGKLPISFEVNAGQADARVKFTAQGRTYKVLLTEAKP